MRSSKSITIAFDLDDVICSRPKKYEILGIDKYNFCKPNRKTIKIINKLWKDGYYIKIYTSRGMTSCHGDVHLIYNKLYKLTVESLDKWKVNYDDLIMGKTHYDLLIDDKAINSASVKSVKDIVKHL